MSEIRLKTNRPDQATRIVKEVLATEALRLSYSLQLARKRLAKFEKKYDISSERFMSEWTAEDLEGQDMEYVEWAGEFELASRLNDRLTTLKNIEPVPS